MSLAPLLAAAFAPRSRQPTWQWAAEHIYLKERSEYWDPHLTPWVCDSLDDFDDPFRRPVAGRPVREDHWMKSSRTGVTEAFFVALRRMPTHRPGDVLYTIDSQEEVRNISKNRLRDTLLQNAGEQLPTDPHDVTSLSYRLKNMTVYLGGGASEAIFNNKAIDVGAVDEPDTQKLNTRGTKAGGTTIDLTRSRFTTVENPYLWVMGKPQLEDGIIHSEYKLGTREIYLVPCPHCGTLQELTRDRLIFDHCKTLSGEWDYPRLARETFIRCAADSCGEMIDERHKRDMVQCTQLGGEARWLQTNPTPRPGVRSRHISDLYSLFPQVRWGMLAENIIRSATSDEKRKFVHNNHFGLPWKPRTLEVDETSLLRLRAGSHEDDTVPRYTIGPPPGKSLGHCFAGYCPTVPATMTLCADVQHDCVKGTVGYFEKDGTFILLGYFCVLGLDDLREIVRREWPVPAAGDGYVSAISEGLIDSGDDTYAIYDWCLENPDLGLWPSKGGSALTGGRLVNPKEFRHSGSPLLRYDYNDHQIKSLLYHDKIARRRAPRLYLPTDLGDHPKFISEFNNESLVIAPNQWGQPVQRWKKKGPNDYPDSVKMHYVIWDQLAARIDSPAPQE